MTLLADAVEAAKANAVGVSNYSAAQLRTAHAALAQRGLFVETTSAILWPVVAETPGDVVAVLTGHGLKTALA